MPVSRHTQTSFASGEFDPLLWSREDVTFFYNAARRIENAVPLPQGGLKRREGFRFGALQRGQIDQIDLTGATVTATHGGTAANAKDGSRSAKVTTTVSIGVTATYEVVRIDLGAAAAVALIDALDLRFVTLPGFTSADMAWQSSPDATTWTTRHTFDVGTTAYDRRSGAAPDAALASARYWRLVVLNTGDLTTATVELSEVRLWTEDGYSTTSAAPGNYAIGRLTASIADEYCLVMTAGNLDVYRFDTGAWVAAVPIPHDDAAVEFIKTAGNLDTVVLYQADTETWLAQRLSGDRNWRSAAFPFEGVAQIEFSDSNVSGGLNEKQRLRVESATAGDTFVIEYNGSISPTVTINADAAITRAAVEAAIEALDDITSVTVTTGGSGVNADYVVEFDGVDGKRFWAVLVVDVLTGDATVAVKRTQYGRPDRDDLWSATRGWPACGAFYQGRHWMGGFKARPDVVVGSRAGNFFDFKADQDPVAVSPILIAPNSDERLTVQAIFASRHLQIFTSGGEFYIPTEPITPDNIALKATTAYGASRLTQPVNIQGGTIFVDRNGRALREYLFTDTEQSYSAEPVSLLAGHLVAQPRSLSVRRARDVDEPTLLLIANTGTDREGQVVPAAMVVIDRAQQVTGFFRVVTEGIPLAFATSQGGDAAALVQRDLAGNRWNYLEFLDDTFMSDCAVEVENADLDDLTATADQIDFPYTFTSPVDAADVAVWTVSDGLLRPLSPDDYDVDLSGQEISLQNAAALGDRVVIVKRQAVIDVSAWPHLEGVEVYVHGDGLPLGAFTVSGGQIDLGDERYSFEAQIGLRMVPRVVMHPYKGRGEVSPTMQKMRIFRALLQLERTLGVSMNVEGRDLRDIPLTAYDVDVFDPILEEILFSGPKRVQGVSGWETEPRLVISQNEPGPWLIRSAAYDVRF